MLDPFTYALREQILPIISNRLQGLLHAFSKQETNYMCENAQHWSQAHYWKREKVSHKNRTERERRRTVAYKQKQWFTSNVVYQIQQQKDIKYTVCMKRTVGSNPSITLCEPLESLTKGDHSITEYYSSSSNLDQNHFFLYMTYCLICQLSSYFQH